MARKNQLLNNIVYALLILLSISCNEKNQSIAQNNFCDSCEYSIIKKVLAYDNIQIVYTDYSDLNNIKNAFIPIHQEYIWELDTSKYAKDSSIARLISINTIRGYSKEIKKKGSLIDNKQFNELASYIISKNSIDTLMAKNNNLHYLTFSKPLFSDDHKYALVEMDNSCFGLCGEGYTYLLEKKDSGWVVISRILRWLS